MSTITNLEIFCQECSGTGKLGSKKCPSCSGRGGFLTQEGQEFMRFMERHFKATALAKPKSSTPKQVRKVPDVTENEEEK